MKTVPIVWSDEKADHPIVAALRDGPKTSRELAGLLGYSRPDRVTRAAEPLVKAGIIRRGHAGNTAVFTLA